MSTVSVIIPTYNRARMLKEAIESVLKQTFTDFELIVVNDHSTDNTEAVIQKFDDQRIRYLAHPEKHTGDEGAAQARNTGISVAQSRYVAFLDDDDFWLPQKLEFQVKKLNDTSAKIGAVYTAYYKVDENDRIIDKVIPQSNVSNFRSLLIRNWIGTTSTVMVKKSCLNDIGIFDPHLPSCQDWDLWLRIARKYRIVPIRKPLVKMRIHQGEKGKTRISKNLKSAIKGRTLLHNKYKESLKNQDRHSRAAYHFEEGRFFAYHLQLRKARKQFWKSLETKFSFSALLRVLTTLIPEPIYRQVIRIKRRTYREVISKQANPL